MALEPGARLGPYEIVGPLGAGGMGEVYRTRDTKLDRDVALKVLPEGFTADADRLARFEREAKVLASLNHPHIAQIYGLEEADGQKALVLELVEGPTLADRIAQGPIPLDEALALAKQIAEALEAAHEQGIIHRDLKPANVKVKSDGTVKVLDFGLAKAFEPEGSDPNASHSPTLTARATQMGVILGTAAYMSPEQARGKPVDKRADIWAFGVCLFEMLTGERPFGGDTTTDVLAAIVGQEPRWHLLGGHTAPRVRELVEQCLQKSARARLRDIGDARNALERSLTGREDASSRSTPANPRYWLVAPVALLATLGGWLLRPLVSPTPAEVRSPLTRFAIELPGESSPPAISPDARLVAFMDQEGLKVRAIDSLDIRLIPGTAGGTAAPAPPFFSPDSQWIGYLSSCCSLHRVRVEGGTPIPVVNTEVISGATWVDGDTIVFGKKPGGLALVAVDRGDIITLTHPRPDEGEQGHTWPHVLPGGKRVLFTVETDSRPSVAVASIETGQHQVLFAGSTPQYVSTGHVVFAQGGTLFAAPLSLDEAKPPGKPFSVLPGVTSVRWGTGAIDYYSVSEGGSLVFVPSGGELTRPTSLVEVDRTGRVLRLVAAGNDYVYPRLSPKESVVVVSEQRETRDLWLLDLLQGRPTRFTFDGSQWISAWTPGGEALSYLSSHTTNGVYLQRIDGSEEPQLLSAGWQQPGAWSPKGDLLAVTRMEPGTRGDIWIVPRDGGEARPYAQTAFAELAPAFSPDGTYLAYVSDESGTQEVYVRPIPGPGAKKAVSQGGGSEPLWAARSSEIFYRRGNELHAVSVRRLAPTIEFGEDRVLFEAAFEKTRVGAPNYDVSRDGQRFFMVRAESQTEPARASIHVVLNWFDTVRDQEPSSR